MTSPANSSGAVVDVVVVSYNNRAELRACVEPLLGAADVNVIVVDNASPDNSLDAVAGLPLTAVELTENRGFAAGVNAGWREGSAPAVLLLNPDARIELDSLRTLVRALDAPGVGAAAPCIRNTGGTLDWSQRRFPRLRSTYARALFLHRMFRNGAWTDELVRDASAYARRGAPEWVSGACVLVRRRALVELGGLDEGFFMYAEDTDLCRRLRSAGYTIVFEPAAVVEHVGGASAPRAALLPALAQSRARYAAKHHGRARAFLERLGLAFEAATHAVAGRGGWATRVGHARALVAVMGPSHAARTRRRV